MSFAISDSIEKLQKLFEDHKMRHVKQVAEYKILINIYKNEKIRDTQIIFELRARVEKLEQ